MNLIRKLSILFGLFFLLLIAVAAIAPLWVDVDQYRPQLVELANRKLNGKVELGKLKLSLWGKVSVEMGGLKVLEGSGTEVLSVDDARFVLPFSSLLAGAPLITLEMRKPRISVIRAKDGTLNVMSLIKKTEKNQDETTSAGSTSSATGTPSQSKASEIVLPGIVGRSKLGLKIVQGSLSFRDLGQSTDASIRELNLAWNHASLTQSSRLEIGFQLETKVAELVSVSGPVRIQFELNPVSIKGSLEELSGALVLDASDLEVGSSVGLKKARGVPIELRAKIGISPSEIRLDELLARFHRTSISSAGRVQLTGADSPRVQLKLKSDLIELSPFEELVEMLKPYHLTGGVKLDAQIEGPSSAIKYSGKLEVQKVGFRMPQFKAAPTVDGALVFSTDRLDRLELKMVAPGSEVSIQGKLSGFLAPQFEFAVNSSGIDLDQWMDWSVSKNVSSQGATEQNPSSRAQSIQGKADATASSGYDALLDPVRKNSIAQAARGAFSIQIRSLRAMKVLISDIQAKTTLSPGLVLQLQKAGMKAYDGSVGAQARVEFKPAIPRYSFSGELKGLDLQKAVEAQFAFLKNTLLGSLSASVRGEGSSFDPARILPNLNVQGDFNVNNGSFATLDIGKMAVDGINQAVEKASEKVALLKGKRLAQHKGVSSRYQVIRSKYSLRGGKFSAPDFTAVAQKDAGIDIKGTLSMDLIQQGLDAKFELTDTYDLTGAKDIGVDLAGQKVEAILAEKGKPVRFPISVGCKLTQPCPSYLELPEHFAKVAGANLAGGAVSKAKTEVQKKIGEALKGVPLPGGLKKLFR